MALFWVAFSLCILTLIFFFYNFVKFRRDRLLKKIDNSYFKKFVGVAIAFTLFTFMAGFGVMLWNGYPFECPTLIYLIFGSFLFGAGLIVFIESFTIYYFKPDLDIKQRKIVRILTFCAIPFIVIFFIMSLEAYAPYIKFPLISGINFSGEGVKFITALEHASGGFTIAWYGIIILSGAILVYFICDHKFYKDYHRHGLIDVLFILVFLMGIFGARFWYCVVLEPGTNFFAFQDGGLAIMGGVLFGASSGIIYLAIFRRYISLRHAMDIILPCVLVAQAVGRWGNFFNHEVFGSLILKTSEVWWLPTFIKNQMAVNFNNPVEMYLPLFFIECITNLTGYFVITKAVPKIFKNHLSLGDLFCCYIIWYGITRMILEPMREGEFEYANSFITACIMLGGGVLGIVAFHVYDYFYYGKYTFNLEKMKTIKTYDYFRVCIYDSNDKVSYEKYFVNEEKAKEKSKIKLNVLKKKNLKETYRLECLKVNTIDARYLNKKNPYLHLTK